MGQDEEGPHEDGAACGCSQDTEDARGPPSWGLGGGVALLGLPASLTVGQETSVALSHQLWPSAARHGDPCSPPFTGQAPPPASRHRSPGARQSRLAPMGCQARTLVAPAHYGSTARRRRKALGQRTAAAGGPHPRESRRCNVTSADSRQGVKAERAGASSPRL